MKQLLFIIGTAIFLNACSVQKKVQKIISPCEHHHQGFLFIDIQTGDTLFEQNADKYFIPASTTKLFTLYSFLRNKPDSLLAFSLASSKDTVFIKPAFDGSLLHPEFRSKEVLIKLKGFKTAVIDQNTYLGKHYGSGWMWDDAADNYQSPLASLPLYEHLVEVSLNADSLHFSIPYLEQRFYSLGQDFIPILSVQDLKNKVAKSPSSFPFVLNDEARAELLSSQLKTNVIFGRVPGHVNYESVYSTPADSVLKYMMYQSDNFLAEHLLLQSGLQEFGDSISSSRVIRNLLENELVGLPQKPRWVDGSGLSRYNLFTPADLCFVLDHMEKEHGLEKLKEFLPVNGRYGTMKTFAADEEPFIYAKSGSMSGVYNLAGYLKTDRGRWVRFAMMHNNFTESVGSVRSDAADFLVRLKSTL